MSIMSVHAMVLEGTSFEYRPLLMERETSMNFKKQKTTDAQHHGILMITRNFKFAIALAAFFIDPYVRIDSSEQKRNLLELCKSKEKKTKNQTNQTRNNTQIESNK